MPRSQTRSGSGRLRRPAGALRRRRPRRVYAPGFELTSQAVRGTHRITVTGELTMVTTRLLDAAMVALHRRRVPGLAVHALVLDLTDVTFLDVIGVTSLQRAYERGDRRGGVRVGLPVSTGPRHLIRVAVDHGWLAPAFSPSTPTW